MKRFDIWLGLVVGATAGLLGGFFLGQGFSSPSTSSSTAAVSPAARKTAGAESSDPASVDGSADLRDWLTRTATRFDQPPVDGSTPGLADALGEVLHQPNTTSQQALLLMLVELMRKDDFPIALDILKKAKITFSPGSVGKNGPDLWVDFWQRYGQLNPDAALDSALQSTDLQYPGRDSLEKWLFRGMALTNPEHAAEAFLAHPELKNRPQIVSGIFGPLVSKDPKSALEWAQQHLAGEELSSAYYTAVWGLSGPNDITRATGVFKDAADPDLRKAMYSQLRSQVDNKPYLPVSQVLDFISATRVTQTADPVFETRMAARLAGTDAFAVANFFAQPLPDGAPNDYVPLRAVMAPWIRRDPKAAEAWAKGQADSAAYPTVAAEFAAAAHERNDAAEEERWQKLAAPR